jgi:hypothetical protein
MTSLTKPGMRSSDSLGGCGISTSGSGSATVAGRDSALSLRRAALLRTTRRQPVEDVALRRQARQNDLFHAGCDAVERVGDFVRVIAADVVIVRQDDDMPPAQRFAVFVFPLAGPERIAGRNQPQLG